MKIFTDLDGVHANGISAGIKSSGKKDLAFIYVPDTTATAAVFTRNECPGANIVYTKKAMKTCRLKAILINSGNANAATGKEGLKNCKSMARRVAENLGLKQAEVGIASTGIIGVQLNMDPILTGIDTLLSNPKEKLGQAAAEAIMTTDLTQKHVYVEKKIGKKLITIAGIAKGSGMIEPNMATMLGFLTTNADIDQNTLQSWLSEAVDVTFNMISVDTDTSTSDMVVMFASGEYQFSMAVKEEVDGFKALLREACTSLATQIARDGEGATKLIEVQVTGAATHRDAKIIAKNVVNSPLVKTAIHGNDPNWGRVLMAVGKTSGVKVNQAKCTFNFAGVEVFKDGEPVEYESKEASGALDAEHVVIGVDLGLSTGTATAWGCDLTKAYIDINVDYN